MKLLKTLLVLGSVFGLGLPPAADAGGLGKVLSRAAMRKLLRQEAVRDAASVVKPLAKPRTVHRYTSRARAVQEGRRGLTPATHTTSVAEPGRPLSQEAAQRRYGLLDKPEVRETIHLPQGLLARHNRVWGGEAGVGEITSPQALPPAAIRKVVPLH